MGFAESLYSVQSTKHRVLVAPRGGGVKVWQSHDIIQLSSSFMTYQPLSLWGDTYHSSSYGSSSPQGSHPVLCVLPPPLHSLQVQAGVPPPQPTVSSFWPAVQTKFILNEAGRGKRKANHSHPRSTTHSNVRSRL